MAGRPDEAEPWLQRAERTGKAEAEPAAGLAARYIRGMLELARGQDADALAAFQAAESLAKRLDAPHRLASSTQAWILLTLIRLGQIQRAEQALADLGELDHDGGRTRIGAATLRLAQDDPHAATAALAPVLDGSVPVPIQPWLIEAFVPEAIARDALGDLAASGRALERALDLAEPDGALLRFLLHPAPGLLERHARNRTAHPALIAEILSLLAGSMPAPSPAGSRPSPSLAPWACSRLPHATDKQVPVPALASHGAGHPA
ncbi:MAG TPA: hypothetical protein VGI96_27030 [Streptosporangiaceae bacterium]